MGNKQSALVTRDTFEDAIVFDVRSDAEYCRGHMHNAILISTPLPPLTQRNKERLRSKLMRLVHWYPRSLPIFLYCKKGVRAGMAKEILEEAGFTNVVSLGGVESGKLAHLLKSLYPTETNRIWWSPNEKTQFTQFDR